MKAVRESEKLKVVNLDGSDCHDAIINGNFPKSFITEYGSSFLRGLFKEETEIFKSKLSGMSSHE
jgi:hypothetical protein